MRLIAHIILTFALLATTALAQRSGHGSRSSSSSSTRTSSSGVVHVKGYTRKDGTYVPPHDRTAPNDTKLDNWSTKGNINPETGKPGTVDPYPENSGTNVMPRSSALGSSDNDSLSNQDVIDMLHDGLAPVEVKRIISETQSSFDTSVSALVELKRAGVPDEVIMAMMNTGPHRDATAGAVSTVKSETGGSPAALNLTSPEVRVFRLGMPMSKALAHFEKDLHITDSGFGLYTVDAYTSIYAVNADEFKGIRELSFEFTDRQLTKLIVSYDGSVRWTSSTEFYRAVCQGLGLQFFPNSMQRLEDAYEHDYSDFVIRLEYNFGIMPKLHVFSSVAKEIVDKRRAEEELRKRQTFRP
jgi:hypothetical protein